MEVSEVRRRLRQAIEQARRESAARRARSDLAARDYARFLAEVATPVFRMLASALGAEGYPFKVFTPAGGLQLVSDRSAEDFVELALDTSSEPAAVVARISRGRGRRRMEHERPVKAGASVPQIGDEDVLAFLLEEIQAFVEK